jgi:hypothetical protein
MTIIFAGLQLPFFHLLFWQIHMNYQVALSHVYYIFDKYSILLADHD